MVARGRSGKSVVVSGGTDGMGGELVLTRLNKGDSAIAIGSDPAKGRRLRADAERIGAADRLHFIRADLSSIAENERVVAEIAARHPVIDALVLCANRQSPRRRVTADGLESTFALYYLSRYLLSHGLRDRFATASEPVIINVAGVGMSAGRVNFADLQSETKYSTIRAQLQAGRANDLLGRSLADDPSSQARILLYHPGFTKTLGGVAHLKQPAKGIITLLGKVAAKPVGKAVAPMSAAIDAPPAGVLTGDDQGKAVDLSAKAFDPDNARKLALVTRSLVLARYGDSALLPDVPEDRHGPDVPRAPR